MPFPIPVPDYLDAIILWFMGLLQQLPPCC